MEALWETLPEEQRTKVEAVTMDRDKAIISGTSRSIPQAAIVHGRFHISAEQDKAVDEVRRA